MQGAPGFRKKVEIIEEHNWTTLLFARNNLKSTFETAVLGRYFPLFIDATDTFCRCQARLQPVVGILPEPVGKMTGFPGLPFHQPPLKVSFKTYLIKPHYIPNLFHYRPRVFFTESGTPHALGILRNGNFNLGVKQ